MESCGKNELKKIEDSTQRQVTYCKRRNGIFKKAQEISVLCDAEVSIIMCSSNNKLHTFTSSTTTIEKIIDQYQRASGIDIWSSHYEKMQEEWRRLKEVNDDLQRDIRLRIGEDPLNDMSMEDLWNLEDMMLKSLETIRNRKYRVIHNQVETWKKKLRNLEDLQHHLLYEMDVKSEFPHGLVENRGDDDKSPAGFANGMSSPFVLQQRENQLNIQDEAGSCISGVTFESEDPF